MYKIKWLVALILFTISSESYSQNLTANGIIIDSISKSPLPYAHIELKEAEKVVKSTFSDKDGKFEFKNLEKKDFEIVIRYVGYKTYFGSINVSAESIEIPKISLSLESNKLNEVTVKASKPLIQSELDKTILNISGTSLSNSGFALDVLKFAPFVQAENGSVSLKGKPVMVLIDGRVVNNKNESLESLLNGIPSQSIEKIELISNPSAKYDASGKAVINIKTLKAKNFGTTGNFTIGGGTGILPRYNGVFLLNYKKDRFSFIGNFTNQFIQQYAKAHNERTTKSGLQRYFEDNDYEIRKRNIQFAKIGLDYYLNSKTTIGLIIERDRNKRIKDINGETQIGSNTTKIDSLIKMKFYGNTIFSNLNNNLNFKHTFEEKGRELTMDLDYGLYNTDWLDQFANTFVNPTTNLNYKNNIDIKTPGEQLIKIKSLKANYIHPLKKGSLESGVQFRRTVLNMDFNLQNSIDGKWVNDAKRSFKYNYNESVNTAFIEFQNKWNKINYKFGLRGETTDAAGLNKNTNVESKQNYIQLFPSSSIQYAPSDTNQFSLTYSRKIVRPQYTEFNNQITFANLYKYYLGNPNLKPTLTNTLEFNYTYNQSLLFTFTYLTSKNEYTLIPLIIDNAMALQNQNYRKYDWIIFDLSYNKNLTKYWQTSSGIEYYQTRNHLESIPGLSFQIGNSFYIFSNNYFKLNKDWKIDLSTYYIGPQVVGIIHWKPFLRTNLSIQKTFLNKKGEVRLNISDIFNTLDYRYNFYSSFQDGVINRKTESRFLQLSFNYKFGNSNVKIKEKKVGIEKEKSRINNNN